VAEKDEEELLEVVLDENDVDVVSSRELVTELELEEVVDETELDLRVVDEEGENEDENDDEYEDEDEDVEIGTLEDVLVEDAMVVDELDEVGAPEITRDTYPAYIREPLSVPGVYTSPEILDSSRQLLF
jgi:hypothetical protein